MRSDVRPGFAGGIIAQAVGQCIHPAERSLGAAGVAERNGIG